MLLASTDTHSHSDTQLETHTPFFKRQVNWRVTGSPLWPDFILRLWWQSHLCLVVLAKGPAECPTIWMSFCLERTHIHNSVAWLGTLPRSVIKWQGLLSNLSGPKGKDQNYPISSPSDYCCSAPFCWLVMQMKYIQLFFKGDCPTVSWLVTAPRDA